MARGYSTAETGESPGARFMATWAALARPRRLVPIAVVAAPLLVAQWAFTHNGWALASGALMLVGFVVAGPGSWRAVVGLEPTGWGAVARWAAFGAVGLAVVGVAGVVLPGVVDLRATFLTAAPSLAILWAMWCVGGWGLGRDIDLEAGLARAEARAEEMARARDQAELLAIRSWLDPHFLFNTLNAIAEWTREDPAVAEAALVRLAGMLRTVLAGLERSDWPLTEELDLLEGVCALHHTRDPTRFTLVKVGWSSAGAFLVPPMVLLPLIENAMKHGVGRGFRGEVVVRVEAVDAGRRVTIESPGPYGGPREGGQGMSMVRRRLDLAYGPAASVVIGESTDRRTFVRVDLPNSMEGRHA